MGKTKAKKNKGEYEWTGDLSRVVPLGDNYCYIRDDKGKTLHLKRDAVETIEILRHLDSVMEGKITRELTKLGWTETLEKL